jgi:glycosyltransferase involved in cell wall biosynthesis
MYNAAPYLAETMESVFAQSFRDYEVIAVDDGSTDNTLALARSYEPRIRVLSQINRGPAAARNFGFANATGDYIAWLDSDDLWHPDLLQTQVAYLDRHPSVGLVYAECWAFVMQAKQRVVVDKVGYTVNPDLKLLLFGDCIPTNTILMRRACYEKIGGMNERLIRSEDYEYLMRLAYSFQFAGIARPLAYYRWRKDSLVGGDRDINRGLRDDLIALQTVEKLHTDLWQRTGVKRGRLFARLQLRAAHAWKRRRAWGRMLVGLFAAFRYSRHPLVIRWLIAALLLKRWS